MRVVLYMCVLVLLDKEYTCVAEDSLKVDMYKAADWILILSKPIILLDVMYVSATMKPCKELVTTKKFHKIELLLMLAMIANTHVRHMTIDNFTWIKNQHLLWLLSLFLTCLSVRVIWMVVITKAKISNDFINPNGPIKNINKPRLELIPQTPWPYWGLIVWGTSLKTPKSITSATLTTIKGNNQAYKLSGQIVWFYWHEEM